MKAWKKISRAGLFCSLIAVFAMATSSQASISVTNSVAGVEVANNNMASWASANTFDMNGGDTVVFILTYEEGASGIKVKYGSQTMTLGATSNYGNDTARIYYLVGPKSSNTNFFITASTPGSSGDDFSYSALSLKASAGLYVNYYANDATNVNTTGGTLSASYTTTNADTFVVGAMINNSYTYNGTQYGPLPTLDSGNPTNILTQQIFAANFGALHCYGVPPSSGSYTDVYSGVNSRTALATVVFEATSAAPPAGVLTFSLDNTTFRSDAAINDLVGHLNATVDGVPANSMYYQLVSGEGDTNNGLFTLSLDYTNLLVNSDFSSYTNDQTFWVRIYGEDLGGSGDFATNTFQLTMQAALLDTTLSKSYFYSGEPISSTVGTLSSSVLGGSVSNVTYSLISGAGDTDNSLFSISGSDLLLNNYFAGSVTNGQPFSVRVQAIGDGKTNASVLAVTAILDDNLDGLQDSTQYTVDWKDDFSTNSVGNYIYSRLVSYSYADPVTTVTNGVLQFANQSQCKTMTVHSTEQLAVGQTVFLDLANMPSAGNSRFGALICATNSLPTDGDRADMVYIANEGDHNPNQWNIGNYVGSDGSGSSSSSFSDWSNVKSVYIERTAVDSFTVGYVDLNLLPHDVATVSNTSMSNSCYVGIWHETYGTATFQVDNLRTEHKDIPYASSFSGDGSKFASGDAVGTVLGTLSSTEYGVPVSSTYSFVGGYDNSKFLISGDQLKLAADLTGSASTNEQVFTVQILAQSDSSSGVDTNLYTLKVVKDDNLDAILDTWTGVSSNNFSSFAASDWTTNNLLAQVAGTANYAVSNGELRVTYPSHAGGGAIRTALLYQPSTLAVGQVLTLDVDLNNYTASNIEERVGLVVSLAGDPVDATIGGSGTYTNVATICARPGYGSSSDLTRQVWDGSGVASENYPSVDLSLLRHLYIYRVADDQFQLGWINQFGERQSVYTATLSDFAGNAAYFGIWSDARTATYNFGVDNLRVYTMTSTPTVGPVVGATLSGGSFIMSWSGGGTYSVLTNADLTNPSGWGVMTSGTSPITNAISSESNLFYKLSN